MNNFYQPYPSQYQLPYQNVAQYNPNTNNFSRQMDQPQNNLLRVNGMDGAKAYQMMPNSTLALFDSNEDIFYVKSSDAGGFANIKAFRFLPIEETKPVPIDTNLFVTRQEFEQLKGELLNGKQFVSKASSKQSKSTTSGED